MKGHLTKMTTIESEMKVVSEPLIDDETVERLMARIEAEGLELLGSDGVLTALTSRIMNRVMQAELTSPTTSEPPLIEHGSRSDADRTCASASLLPRWNSC